MKDEMWIRYKRGAVENIDVSMCCSARCILQAMCRPASLIISAEILKVKPTCKVYDKHWHLKL